MPKQVQYLVLAIAIRSAQPAWAACSDVGYHDFDFWLGERDVVETGGGEREAHASITSIETGCGIRDVYRSNGGAGGGESLNTFDPFAHLWRQSWLSDKGQIAGMEGRTEGNSIIIVGPESSDVAGRIIEACGRRFPEERSGKPLSDQTTAAKLGSLGTT